MSKVIKLENNKDQSMQVTTAWKGINIGLWSYNNDANAAATLIDPHSVLIKISNNVTKKSVFDGTILELWQFFHRGEESLEQHMSSQSVVVRVGSTNEKSGLFQDFSIKTPVQWGDYNIRVETKNSIPVNHKTDSFVSVTMDYTDESSSFEWCLTDDSVDRKNDSFTEQGVAAAILVNMTKAAARTSSSIYDTDIAKVSLSCDQESWNRDKDLLASVNASFHENPSTSTYPMIILHDNHLITGDGGAGFEVDTINVSDFKFYALTLTRLPVAVAQLMASKVEEKDEKVMEKINM